MTDENRALDARKKEKKEAKAAAKAARIEKAKQKENKGDIIIEVRLNPFRQIGCADNYFNFII